MDHILLLYALYIFLSRATTRQGSDQYLCKHIYHKACDSAKFDYCFEPVQTRFVCLFFHKNYVVYEFSI